MNVPSSMQVALFGTSADPPTLGHQIILQWLSDRFDHVAVWASDNPFKADQIPLFHRTAMMQLLLNELAISPHRLQLHPELSSPRALLTLDRARRIWPHAEFTWVMGSDLVRQLPKWYCIDELLAQVRLLIVPRPGYELQETDLQGLRNLQAKFAIASLQPPAVSSTAYRTQQQSQGIPIPIQNYIQKEHLYEWQNEWQDVPQNPTQSQWQKPWPVPNRDSLNANLSFRRPVNR